MSFYMYLPSNSSFKVFPGNSIGHFRTKLEKRITNLHHFEAALTELSYFNEMKIFDDEEDRLLDIRYPD